MPRFILLLFSFLICYTTVKAQNTLLTDLEIDFHLFNKWNLSFDGDLTFEKAYNVHDWNTWGAEISINKSLGLWTLNLGANDNYTIDRTAPDYNNVVLYGKIQLRTVLSPHLDFNQKVKEEFRYFFYHDGQNNSFNTRFRYALNLTYRLHRHEVLRPWALIFETEFFILKNPSIGERYVNKQNYSWKIDHFLSNGKRWEIDYTFNNFGKSLQQGASDASTIGFTYYF